MSFHQPSVWFLLMLLLLPLIWMRWRSPKRRAVVQFSSIAPAEHLGSTWAVRMRWIIPALRIAALAVLIIAMARLQKGDEQTRINTEGIAIQLVVDRSGSMRAQDFEMSGHPVDRLTVVKSVVQDFVIGGKGLAGRPDDLIGCIAFASFADSICPLTTDHTHLIDSLAQVKAASDRQESATAIGDAIALGVERLKSLEQRVQGEGGPIIKGKIMILLTDGENNAGDIDPVTAAQMAAAFGMKVYTIGAGSANGMAPMPVQDVLGRNFMQQIPVSIDEDMLRKIAQISGGQYFRASDTSSLRNIYEQIDKLERTKIHESRYVNYKELAVEPVRLAGLTLPPLLLVALGLLSIEMLLSATRFRTLP
jgi:Ca-activated chloride channel family protein